MLCCGVIQEAVHKDCMEEVSQRINDLEASHDLQRIQLLSAAAFVNQHSSALLGGEGSGMPPGGEGSGVLPGGEPPPPTTATTGSSISDS